MTQESRLNALRQAVDFEREGKFDNAERLYRWLIGLSPAIPMAHYTYACFRLLMGEFEDTWGHFQIRLADSFYQQKGTFRSAKPLWDGFDVSDQRVFLHVDQGIGDAVMCARFLPWVADRAGSVVIAVHRRAGRFFAAVDPRLEVVELGEATPDFDCHIDMFSLPALYHATADNLPPPPYFDAGERRRMAWRERLAGAGPSVGLAWQGNPDHPRDAERSIPLAKLRPVLETNGVRFFALQIGAGSDQVADLPEDIRPTDLSPDLGADGADLIDAAAAVAELDLLITIDSALAHVAGAMAQPVWIPTYRVPDWRWGHCVDRAGPRFAPSHWYSAQRLFVKSRNGVWDDVVARLALALAAWRDGEPSRASVETDV